MPRPAFDLVLHGATSFVGRIVAEHLVATHGVGRDLRWAISGRSPERLHALRDLLGRAAAKLPVIVADAGDDAALRALCARTRVVASTVGPYALYGDPLVAACVAAGTDYCDLTGEVQWVRRMIARHQRAAVRSGARIVHCCGFDSLPSDLGVHVLQREAVARFGAPLERIRARVWTMRGGFSGGTIASLLNVVDEARRDPALRRTLADPYALCPSSRARRPRQPEVRLPEYDDAARAWVAPFVMAAINTRVVHRSNALSGQAYGRGFRYDEAVYCGPGLAGRARATAMAGALAAGLAAGVLPPLRAALQRFVLPAPGEGPSPEQQRHGRWELRFFGEGPGDARLVLQVTGDRDPGYGSTGKMFGEAAIALAGDRGRKRRPGGFWTPATVLGDRLVERLVAHAGVRFAFLDD
ncbi:MAG: saccharopine dehydrogenase NADP-binding domain-containing protein [Xanthomonadaceae bacterium]|nr:saccharopine dehydrogenase NADP-binding domain-containing protein [Xanthomonadaceae bacterium]